MDEITKDSTSKQIAIGKLKSAVERRTELPTRWCRSGGTAAKGKDNEARLTSGYFVLYSLRARQMNPEELLRHLVENWRAWVQAQRDHHRRSARKLTLSEKVALNPFFENRILDIARGKRVPLIENPGFYVDLNALGIPSPLDFTNSHGITFMDTILVSDRYCPSTEPLVPLLFHELVHVVQCALLGRDAFVEHYVLGWAENGQDYFRIPMESHAYALQTRYEANPLQGFSVEAEVRRQLGLP